MHATDKSSYSYTEELQLDSKVYNLNLFPRSAAVSIRRDVANGSLDYESLNMLGCSTASYWHWTPHVSHLSSSISLYAWTAINKTYFPFSYGESQGVRIAKFAYI